jgi:2,4-dienoyl-CoA reductase (NADPH2)
MGSMHTGLEHHSLPNMVAGFFADQSARPEKDHDSLHKMAVYFRRRAEGGVGLMVTGGIAPSAAGWVGPFASQLTNTTEMERHRVVTEAVHSVLVPCSSGDDDTIEMIPARICLQILHTGRYAYHPLAVSASPTKSPISPYQAKQLDNVQGTVRDYVHTAVLAKQAGYDGVEIMGSEGYLISQFLSPRTNQRTDAYGGSLDNRARLPLEIIRETRAACGPDFIIIFRLSLLDLVEDGLLFEESLKVAAMVEQAGATILNTGIGWHESRVPTIATSVPRAAFAFPTIALKEAGVVSIPVVATNRINTAQTAERVLQSGVDLISMARPFLADPDLMLKAREQREDEINTCIGCNQACLDHVFFGKVASCLVNPLACHETELVPQLLPDEQRLRIGVVGAGPAGCAFAITAAQQGHTVTLYDRDDQVGGQFHMAKRIPGKEEFYETLRYFRTMLNKLKVNVQLDTEISLDQMKADTSIDKWVVAAGVTPRNVKIPGIDHPNVLSYIDVLKRNKAVGKKVAVIGAGGIGFDVAEFLVHHQQEEISADQMDPKAFWEHWGIDKAKMANRGGLKVAADPVPDRQIYLLQRKTTKVGAGLGKTTGWIHKASLQKANVNMIKGVSYDKIDEHGHLHITQEDGAKRVLDVDSIVVCAGQLENRELANDGVYYLIGGAYKAGELDAKRAIDMGTRLALKIHEAGVVPGKHVFSAAPSVEENLNKFLKRFM